MGFKGWMWASSIESVQLSHSRPFIPFLFVKFCLLVTEKERGIWRGLKGDAFITELSGPSWNLVFSRQSGPNLPFCPQTNPYSQSPTFLIKVLYQVVSFVSTYYYRLISLTNIHQNSKVLPKVLESWKLAYIATFCHME